MCGIAGIFGSSALSYSPIFERVVRKQQHRGPDTLGIYTHAKALLGHNRLSILDVSAAANQPMVSDDGRYVLVYNGEVFNHRELRSQYGLNTVSSGDTAVVLELLVQLGAAALSLFNGFFALAFYDTIEKTLLLARDRFGEKPLWYTHKNETLFFASELKTLRSLGLKETIDRESLHSFLRFTYIPGPYSIFEGYQKLEPGYCLVCSETSQHLQRWYTPSAPSPLSFDALLDQSVALRMQSDVPIGAFLSGGIDSAMVLALARKHRPDITAYSLGFPDNKNIDESLSARATAHHLKVNYTQLPASMSDLKAEWSFFVNALDEPFADSSALAVSLLCRKMRENVVVAISGDGADEYLGGYRKHRAWLRLLNMHPFQKRLLQGALSVFDGLVPAQLAENFGRYRAVKKFQKGMNASLAERYLQWASWCTDTELDALFPDRTARLENRFAALQSLSWSSEKAILEADQLMVLPNDMLVKIDLMSMAHSLEIRSPFLDVHLVEKMRSLAADDLFTAAKGKLPLRAMASALLPKELLHRPKKGFEIPLDAWLQGSFKQEAKERLSALQQHHLVHQKGLEMLQKKLDSGLHGSAPLVFSLMVLHAWLEKN